MLLGDVSLKSFFFTNLEDVFLEFKTKDFQELIDRRRSEWVNRVLLDLIQQQEAPCFLLPAVLKFIEKVESEKLLNHYTFASFELWLNQYSNLSAEENFEVRSKIVGKRVERGDYQVFFPIGTGKMYEGTHFVTAHKSPDLDTTIASFWGWVDAFAARVGTGLHIWNLPGGPPGSQIEIDLIFRDFFTPAVFTHLPKTRSELVLTSNDLMTQRNLIRMRPHESIAAVDHERGDAVVVIDNAGFFLDDWRPVDVERVRQVIILLSSCLRWFENTLHLLLISVFAKETVVKSQIEPLVRDLFDLKLASCEPAREFSPEQTKSVQKFLFDVLNIPKGMEASFSDLGKGLAKMGVGRFASSEELFSEMDAKKLFDDSGSLIENRPAIFHYLEGVVRELHASLFQIRTKMECFDMGLAIKSKVFAHPAQFVSVRADVEEIRSKMGSYFYLTVAYPDQGRFYPVGVIYASDVRRKTLGTVSLRDFCNREEMGIPAYLDVISVVDHHKSALNTGAPPVALIGDAQSSNSLVAERTFRINDRYSLGAMDAQEIDKQLQKIDAFDAPRVVQRLLQRRMAAQNQEGLFIHPDREFLEYLHFLYGILDDTDLLSKVTSFDVEIVASLVNRLKSIALKKEVEVIHFDDLSRDAHFPKQAAKRLLQNEDLYSLYRKVYQFREKEVARNIELCAEGNPSNLFADTKVQNGCCRVGQTKIFASNVALFEKKASAIRRFWLERASAIFKENTEVHLHMHMISTIVSAQEVFKGVPEKRAHRDELWIWCPEVEVAVEHLKQFLSAFQHSPGLVNNTLDAEFLGDNAEELMQIFRESFREIPLKKVEKGSDARLPIAILHVNPGSLNSRKALVSPFLPSL